MLSTLGWFHHVLCCQDCRDHILGRSADLQARLDELSLRERDARLSGVVAPQVRTAPSPSNTKNPTAA